MTPPGPGEIFPDSDGLVAYMIDMRERERALTCTHIINWIKRNQREWLTSYIATKKPGSAYNSLLKLMQQFCKRHGFSRQRSTKANRLKNEMLDARDEYAKKFHEEFAHFKDAEIYNADETAVYYEMPPRVIWAVRGGDAKIAAGEKHSLRMTELLTIRADGKKLPMMFVMRGKAGGTIENQEFPTFPDGHVYAVQNKGWMDSHLWPIYLREVFGEDVEEPSVLVVDNFEAHVNDESYCIVSEEFGCQISPLPPNTTAVSQPLDVGIMAPFKRHLRDLWLLEDEIECNGDDSNEGVSSRQKRLAMIHRSIKAWDLVTEENVRRSFVKAIPNVKAAQN
ncbi:hypothetical protein DYB32_006091 [Aphanomyces invadans]|uniref:DDE-1 domain-containing protein n=1 Tax=Aphanomyces invadans TaxID=157072 RepID=A0A418ASH6_9STRA|nr:hypothetical protein DYB32_006091 [Aphanomyces invadans]